MRTSTIEQLDLVDAKAATLLQFIGILVAVAAIVASLTSLAASNIRGDFIRELELIAMAALMVIVLFAGGYGLSCIHMFDMTGRLQNGRPNLNRDEVMVETIAWLRHALVSRRRRYRIAYALTWIAFLLIMALVTLHMYAETRV